MIPSSLSRGACNGVDFLLFPTYKCLHVHGERQRYEMPGTLFLVQLFSTAVPRYCLYIVGLDEAESPVITWVQVLGSYLWYLGGVS